MPNILPTYGTITATPLRPESTTPRNKTHSSGPLPLLQADLASNALSFLQYDALDLSLLIVSRCRIPIFTYLNADERAWVQADNIDFSYVWHDDDIYAYLSYWALILDKVFFFGLVSPFVNLRYDKEDLTSKYGGKVNGSFRPTLQFDDPGYPTPSPMSKRKVVAGAVCIHQPNTFNEADFEVQMYELVGRLAHEMLHAWFSTYTCMCVRRCRRIMRGPGRLGSHGHGKAWADAMFAIQQRLRTDLGKMVGCNVGDLLVDIEEGGDNPSEEKLNSWGLAKRHIHLGFMALCAGAVLTVIASVVYVIIVRLVWKLISPSRAELPPESHEEGSKNDDEDELSMI